MKITRKEQMYHPVVKNKLNELKGIGALETAVQTKPIIELIECKYEEITKFFDKTFSKMDSYLRYHESFIDLSQYVSNEVITMFELDDAQKKCDFFLQLKEYFTYQGYKPFTPVVSFDYSHETQRKSFRDNIKLVSKIGHEFGHFSIRIFSDSTYINSDADLLGQIFAFYDDELTCDLIIDTDKTTTQSALDVVKNFTNTEMKNKIILIGECFFNEHRIKTDNKCDHIKNHHLERFRYFLENVPGANIAYGDYTLTTKYQSKLELEEGQGFMYYPFLNYTNSDGSMCKFTADTLGNYHQYQELCRRVIENIPDFSIEHCSTCKFIEDVANDLIDKFKSGGTWKHRMIAHHITSMARLI